MVRASDAAAHVEDMHDMHMQTHIAHVMSCRLCSCLFITCMHQHDKLFMSWPCVFMHSAHAHQAYS